MSFLAIKKKARPLKYSMNYYYLIRVLYIKNRNIKPEYFSCPTYEKVDYVSEDYEQNTENFQMTTEADYWLKSSITMFMW